MLERFYPDETADSSYEIDYEGYYEAGYRGVIYDVDNTLVPHGAPADERAKALFARLLRCTAAPDAQRLLQDPAHLPGGI